MSSSNESEDDKNLKQVLEASDTSFLTNSLFKTKPAEKEELQSKSNELLSQRHLTCDESTGIDFVPTETVQKIMAKKLSILLHEQIEFITPEDLCKKLKKTNKSRVRLLNEFDCYVKPFEDFEYEDLGPRKKPLIKRRNVDGDDEYMDEESKLKVVAIDGEFILSLKETVNWSNRSKGKVYQYKMGKGVNKDHHLIEPLNEFTKTRNKNQWNELKIRKAKFLTK